MKTEYKKAFTLAEIMIVLAVLSVLMAVMLPAMTKKKPEPVIYDPIWKRHEINALKSIYYGIGDKQGASIGKNYNASDDKARLVLTSSSDDQIQLLYQLEKQIPSINSRVKYLRGIYFGSNNDLYIGSFTGIKDCDVMYMYTLECMKGFTNRAGSNNLVIRPAVAPPPYYRGPEYIGDAIPRNPAVTTLYGHYLPGDKSDEKNNTIIGYGAAEDLGPALGTTNGVRYAIKDTTVIGAYALSKTDPNLGIMRNITDSTIIGYEAGENAHDIYNITAIGSNAAGYNYNTENTKFIGAYAGYGTKNTSNGHFIGSHAGYNYNGDSYENNTNNIAVGYLALGNGGDDDDTEYIPPTHYNNNSISIGYKSNYNNYKSGINPNAYNNIAVGAYSMNYSQTNDQTYNNISIGYAAKTNGYANTAITTSANETYGSTTWKTNTNGRVQGYYNTVIGAEAVTGYNYGYSNYNNVLIGNNIKVQATNKTGNIKNSVYINAKLDDTNYDNDTDFHFNSVKIAAEDNEIYMDDYNTKHILGIGWNACQPWKYNGNYTGFNNGTSVTCIGYNSGPRETSSSSTLFGDIAEKTIFLGNNTSDVYMPHIRVGGNVNLSGQIITTTNPTVYNVFTNHKNEKTLFVNQSGGENDNTYKYTQLSVLADDAYKYSNIWMAEFIRAKNSNSVSNKRYADLDNYSDRKLKNIKGENKSGLDKIRQLKVFNYTFKADKLKTPHVGVIAQDLQKIFPDAVSKDKDGYLTIRLSDMFYALVNSVKELNKYIEGIYAQVDVLNSKITKLEQRKDSLKIQNKQLKEQISALDKRLKRVENN